MNKFSCQCPLIKARFSPEKLYSVQDACDKAITVAHDQCWLTDIKKSEGLRVFSSRGKHC